MKTFRIMSMSIRGDMPGLTDVTVAVIDDQNGINQLTLYEFYVEGQYESVTPELEFKVEVKLKEAGIL